MSHVSAVVEADLAPPIGCVLSVDSIWLQGIDKAVQAIVVTGGTGGNVPGSLGVFKACGVNDIVVQRLVALVVVCVGLEDEVYFMFHQQRLEDILAHGAHG